MTTTLAPPQADPAVEPAPPVSPPPHKPRRRPGKRALIAAGTVAALAAALFLLVTAITGDSKDAPAVKGSSDASFKLNVPENWVTVGGKELEKVPDKPLTVVRRKDGLGYLIVRQEGVAPKSFEAFTRQLDKEFKQRIPDFQRRSVRTLKVAAGPAFFYSYIRRKQGTVNSVVIVPNGERSYTINSVAKGGEDDVAKELGKMIVSFDF